MPRKWSKKFNIKKGDELEVEEKGDTLTVNTEGSSANKEVEVDISGMDPRMGEVLVAKVYQKGYDKITIKYDDAELGMSIQNKVKELLGFEVMEKTKNKIVINSISKKLDIEFDPSLRRAFLILIDIAETAYEGFKKNDKKMLESVWDKDFDLNKFSYFCLRTIRKGLHGEFGNYILYFIIETVEYVGDEFKALCRNLEKVEGKAKKPIIAELSELSNLTKSAYGFFYNPSKEKINKASETYKNIIDGLASIQAKEKKEIAAINSIYLIAKNMHRIPSIRLDTIKEFERYNGK